MPLCALHGIGLYFGLVINMACGLNEDSFTRKAVAAWWTWLCLKILSFHHFTLIILSRHFSQDPRLVYSHP